MGVLDGTEIILDGQIYKLLREELARKMSRRRWQVERQRIATKRVPRPDVRPGETPGDFVITWSDWSKGICGDHENLPGCIHYAAGVHGLIPGVLRPAWVDTFQGIAITTEQETRPVRIVEWGSRVFYFMGRYVYTHDPLAVDLDMGAGYHALDAEVHNDDLIVATNGFIRTKDGTGGAWSLSPTAYATSLTAVENRLWRSQAYTVSNITMTDNPLAEASWSAGIAMGQRADLTEQLVSLVGYGERLAVATCRTLRIGDQAAIFPAVINRPAIDYSDGYRIVGRGADIFYPHRHGLIRYDGSSVEEVGIAQHFSSANEHDRLPGTEICALTNDGRYLWAVTRSGLTPSANPTGVLFTQNNGTAYSDGRVAVTDDVQTTTMALTAWDTLANGDYLLVGYSSKFFGVIFNLAEPNNNNNPRLVGSYVTAAGPPVVATQFPAVCAFDDDTTYQPNHISGNATPFRNTGSVTWTDRGSDLASWVPVTIGGVSAYWVRFSLTGVINNIQIAELRVVPNDHQAHVWRGRPSRPGDVRDSSIIWEPYTVLEGAAYAGAIGIASATTATYNATGTLVILAKQRVYALRREWDWVMPGHCAYPGGGYVVSAKHNGGSPEILKQWHYIRAKTNFDALGASAQFEYRVDESDPWLTAGTINSSTEIIMLPAGVLAYQFQWRLTFAAYTGEIPPEVYEIEIGLRELDTWKNYGTYLLEVYDNASASEGGNLPDSDIQLTALEQLQGGGAVVLRDATRRNQTVTVKSVKQQEVFQEALGYPVLAVEVQTAEV